MTTNELAGNSDLGTGGSGLQDLLLGLERVSDVIRRTTSDTVRVPQLAQATEAA